MVQPEAPSVTTRLQARVDAHEEKIQNLSMEMKELSATVSSMKDILQGLPNSIEKMMMGFLKQQGKRPLPEFDDDGSLHNEDENSGSGPKLHGDVHKGFFLDNPDHSLFSLPKVELPLFDGIDPRGWITKAELYFQVHQTPPSQKLKLVQMCMDGAALNWFTTLFYKHPNTDWCQFQSKLMIRFSGTRFLNAYEALGSLYQEGDVEDYIQQFEALSALIPTQSEEQSIGLFLRGLQPDIRNWVRTLNPVTCDDAMDTARHVEIATRTTDEEPGPGGGRFHLNPGGYSQSWNKDFIRTSPKTGRPAHNINPITQPIPQYAHLGGVYPNRNTNTRHLTKLEWEERRKKGLCFSCGQRYSPQHKCAEGQLRVMLLADGEQLDADGEIVRSEEAEDGTAIQA